MLKGLDTIYILVLYKLSPVLLTYYMLNIIIIITIYLQLEPLVHGYNNGCFFCFPNLIEFSQLKYVLVKKRIDIYI